ncbi:MAG: hypothetical protein AAB665_02460 [Patescibacteria group bacterium]
MHQSGGQTSERVMRKISAREGINRLKVVVKKFGVEGTDPIELNGIADRQFKAAWGKIRATNDRGCHKRVLDEVRQVCKDLGLSTGAHGLYGTLLGDASTAFVFDYLGARAWAEPAEEVAD